jgi:hypothetical protein
VTIPTRHTSRVLAAFALALIIAACGTRGDQLSMDSLSSGSAKDASASTPAFADMGRGVALGAARERRAAANQAAAPEAVKVTSAPPPPAQPQSQTQIAATGMIIRNGFVNVEVDSLEIAIDRVRALTASLGGYLGNVSMQTGERQVRSATLEMKIPAARFDSAMVGMPALGKVEHSSATAEDVGEEFVDITARVANAKRLEARLIALLASRTARLQDVLSVERELARVREEIERHEGRIRYLASRVATSTITATVHEKYPVIAGQPGTNVFAAAFLNMWRNFVRFLATGIEMLGVVIPVALLAWAAYAGWRRWRRGRIPATA